MTDEELTNYFSDVDLGIMLPGATPADKEYSAMQNVLKKISEELYIFIGLEHMI